MLGAPYNRKNRKQRTENKNFNLSKTMYSTWFLIGWNSYSLFLVPFIVRSSLRIMCTIIYFRFFHFNAKTHWISLFRSFCVYITFSSYMKVYKHMVFCTCAVLQAHVSHKAGSTLIANFVFATANLKLVFWNQCFILIVATNFGLQVM